MARHREHHGTGTCSEISKRRRKRSKDIRYASTSRINMTRVTEIEELRSALHRELDNFRPSPTPPLVSNSLPEQARERQSLLFTSPTVTIQNRQTIRTASFLAKTVTELWEFGYGHACKSLASQEWRAQKAWTMACAKSLDNGVRNYELTA
jgi:hypothetical protein